jgi:hypothetical protein
MAITSEPAFLLDLFRAVPVDGEGTSQGLHIDLNPDRTGCLGHFFGEYHGRQPAHFVSPVFFRNNRAEKAQLRHGFDDFFVRKIVFFIPFISKGRDLFRRKVPGHLTEHL